MVHANRRKEHSMDTIHVTRAGAGEHWLVVTDVTTIKASGRNTSGKLLAISRSPSRPAEGPRSSTSTSTRRSSYSRRASSKSPRETETTPRAHSGSARGYHLDPLNGLAQLQERGRGTGQVHRRAQFDGDGGLHAGDRA